MAGERTNYTLTVHYRFVLDFVTGVRDTYVVIWPDVENIESYTRTSYSFPRTMIERNVLLSWKRFLMPLILISTGRGPNF